MRGTDPAFRLGPGAATSLAGPALPFAGHPPALRLESGDELTAERTGVSDDVCLLALRGE
jgi:hypothetical protein